MSRGRGDNGMAGCLMVIIPVSMAVSLWYTVAASRDLLASGASPWHLLWLIPMGLFLGSSHGRVGINLFNVIGWAGFMIALTCWPFWLRDWWKVRQAERASPVPLSEIRCSGCGKKPHELNWYWLLAPKAPTSWPREKYARAVFHYGTTYNRDDGTFVCYRCKNPPAPRDESFRYPASSTPWPRTKKRWRRKS